MGSPERKSSYWIVRFECIPPDSICGSFSLFDLWWHRNKSDPFSSRITRNHQDIPVKMSKLLGSEIPVSNFGVCRCCSAFALRNKEVSSRPDGKALGHLRINYLIIYGWAKPTKPTEHADLHGVDRRRDRQSNWIRNVDGWLRRDDGQTVMRYQQVVVHHGPTGRGCTVGRPEAAFIV